MAFQWEEQDVCDDGRMVVGMHRKPDLEPIMSQH